MISSLHQKYSLCLTVPSKRVNHVSPGRLTSLQYENVPCKMNSCTFCSFFFFKQIPLQWEWSTLNEVGKMWSRKEKIYLTDDWTRSNNLDKLKLDLWICLFFFSSFFSSVIQNINENTHFDKALYGNIVTKLPTLINVNLFHVQCISFILSNCVRKTFWLSNGS